MHFQKFLTLPPQISVYKSSSPPKWSLSLDRCYTAWRHGNNFVCKMFTYDLSIVKKTVENGDGLDGHMIDLSIVFKKKSHLPRGVGMMISYWVFRFSVTTVATVTDIYWHLLIFRTTDIIYQLHRSLIYQFTDIYWYLLIFSFYWYFTDIDITHIDQQCRCFSCVYIEIIMDYV